MIWFTKSRMRVAIQLNMYWMTAGIKVSKLDKWTNQTCLGLKITQWQGENSRKTQIINSNLAVIMSHKIMSILSIVYLMVSTSQYNQFLNLPLEQLRMHQDSLWVMKYQMMERALSKVVT